MIFELGLSTRQRKCGMCARTIEKREQHFTLTQYDPEVPYPIKKNICRYCASRVTEDEFLKFLKELVSKLTILKLNNTHMLQVKQEEGKESVF